jgi:uncharacterized protein (TIGR00730 family)
MSPPERRICVFCGSSDGGRPLYKRAAQALADELVDRGFGLVYGGGQLGLMGTVARRVLDRGGEVTGIIPRTLADHEEAFEDATALHVVGSMHERKAMMSEMSSGFIAMPGGFGTLEELFETITWAMLGIHQKPFGLLDVDDFYGGLLGFLDHATDEGFIRPQYRAMVRSATEPAELLDLMEAWDAPQPIQWLHLDET